MPAILDTRELRAESREPKAESGERGAESVTGYSSLITHHPSLRTPHPAESGEPSPTKDQGPRTKDETEELLASFGKDRLRWRNVDWAVFVWMAGIHLGCLAAPFFFTWQALGVCVLLHWLTCSLGVCLGYHRYLAHGSFRLAWPAKFVTMLCGVLSGEGSPLAWAATHRLHHQKSDEEGDPHSPTEGTWWSHLLWLFIRRSDREKELLFQRYVPRLARQPMMRFFERTYGLWLVASGLALFLLGGLPVLLWGLCVRMTFAYHSTWFVNSATHLWGYRNYETRDHSRNLWWVALLAYGEGWHNNHHAHPANARAGHRWWEIDMTFWVIRLLQVCRLARNVRDEIPQKAEG